MIEPRTDEPARWLSSWHVARVSTVAIAVAVAVLLFCLVYFVWLRPDVPAGVAPLPAPSLHGVPLPASMADPAAPPIDQFLPEQTLQLTPDQALAKNLATPMTKQNPAPPPFAADWMAPTDFDSAKQCLATAVYYEAHGEPIVGQAAVAQVVLNRLRHPRYPKAICDVVYQGAERKTGCQFTFACDGSLAHKPDPVGWLRAQAVADAALHGSISRIAGQATHYHTIWVYPVWAAELAKVALVGNHIFYRPLQTYGDFTSFRQQHPFLPPVTQDLVSGDATLSTTMPEPEVQVDNVPPLAPPISQPGNVASAVHAPPPTNAPGAPPPVPIAPNPPATKDAKRSLFGSDRSHRPNLPIPNGN